MQVKTLLVMACTVAGFAAVAHADAYECKSTETKAECFDRLKCKADEDLEDCQKRLRAAASSRQNNNNNNGRDDDDDRDRRDRDDSDRDSGRRSRGDRDRDDNDRGDSDGNDRVYRDRGGDNRRSSGRGRRRGGGNSSYASDKKFGLGLELGEPAGLNGKYFVQPSQALDFGVGYVYDHYYYGDGFHLYADYLFHFSLASTRSFELPFYVGPGLRYWQFDYCVQNLCDYGGSAVGVRVPLGIAFDFNNAPLDIFVQLVPTLDFLSGDYYMRYGDRAHFGIDGSVGLRFWFN